jgi:hypothetical protein
LEVELFEPFPTAAVVTTPESIKAAITYMYQMSSGMNGAIVIMIGLLSGN